MGRARIQTIMPDKIIHRILQQYGITANAVLPTQSGYRSTVMPVQLADGRQVTIIAYKREPGIVKTITNANRISNYLANRGFPARRTADDRILRLSNGRQAQYAALYEYLPGTTIPWEAYTMEHVKTLGQTLSDIHAALNGVPQANLPAVATQCLHLLHQMQAYFAQPGVQQAMQRKLGVRIDAAKLRQLQAVVQACPALPGQQPLHMDFVRGNVLFADGTSARITGILDFEKTAYGLPAFDIARTLAFLLVDCKYKPPDKTRKYFLHSGYQKRGQAALRNPRLPNGQRLLDSLIELFLMHDFYKFLRHNPYEYLVQNQHYIRTKHILLSKNILSEPANAKIVPSR